MKKIFVTLALLCVCAGVFAACNEAPRYEEGWTFDETYHWKKSLTSNVEIAQKAKHDFGSWTIVSEATHLTDGSRKHTCATCGYEATETVAKSDCENTKQLSEAVEAAKSGDTINVKGEIVFTDAWTVNNSVILQGVGNTFFTGRPLYVKSDADVTFRNITFRTPDNSSESHANNNASCVYAQRLTGKLTFESCTFADAPWDSMQITFEPSSTAEITVKNCTFHNTVQGYRYVHLQTTGEEAPNVKFVLSGNTFYNVSTAFCKDSAITVYGPVKSNMTFENNVFTGAGATKDELTTAVVWVSNGVDAESLLDPSDVGKIYSQSSQSARMPARAYKKRYEFSHIYK